MKQLIWIVAAVFFMAACNNAEKTKEADSTSGQQEISMENLVEVTIDVGGMTCEGCENAVKKSINSLPGISEVSASHIDSVAVVKYDKTQASLEEIELKIADAGYTVIK